MVIVVSNCSHRFIQKQKMQTQKAKSKSHNFVFANKRTKASLELILIWYVFNILRSNLIVIIFVFSGHDRKAFRLLA